MTQELTIWDRLAAPFDDVKQLSVPGRPTLDYVTAQAVEQRLDEVLGPNCWWAVYKVLSWQPVVVECRLSVDMGEEVIVKHNVGEAANESEAAKAAYSDAFKRAARAFGVARYLALDEQPQTQQPRQEPAPPEQGYGRAPSTKETIDTPSEFWAHAKSKYGLAPDQVCQILGVTTGIIANSTEAELSMAAADLASRTDDLPF